MKNKIFNLIMYSLAIVFTIASLSMIFAWYTNVNKVGEIDAEAGEVSITYNINNRDVKNEESYEIFNLAFFDLNNTNELEYFSSMVKPIKLTINNLDNLDKIISLSYSTQKIIKEKNGLKTSVAYPIGIIGNTPSIDTANKSKVLDLLPENRVNTETEYKQDYQIEIKANSSVDIYIHLFGVQEIPSSDNSFLVNPDFTPVNYQFSLTLEGVNKKSNVVAKAN